MDEIKIWSIGGSEITEVQPTNQAESEQWLEDNLVGKPDLLGPVHTKGSGHVIIHGWNLHKLITNSSNRTYPCSVAM